MDTSDLDAAMDRYADGDDRAFAILHAGLYSRLFAYFRRAGDAAAADDLVQETLLRLHRARATFAAGSALLPWVYAIARNALLDHQRASRARAHAHEPLCVGSDAEPQSSRDGDAEAVAMASEAARTVERVLARLPASQREAFMLIRYEGLRVEEAAVVLGTTPTAVKLRTFRASEALRAALGLPVAAARTPLVTSREAVAHRSLPQRGLLVPA